MHARHWTYCVYCEMWIQQSEVLQCWLLFCVRMMSPVPCALSTIMLCLLKLMKHTVIWSLLLYWRCSTWLGKLFLQISASRHFWSCLWQFLVNRSSMAMTDWRFLMILIQNQQIIRNTESYEDWCCTGDTWLGSVNYPLRKLLMIVFLKIHFTQNMHDIAAVSNGWLVLQKCGNYQKCKRIFVCQMFLKIYNRNKHI